MTTTHVRLTLQVVTKSETRKRHHDWGGDYSHPLEWGPGGEKWFHAPIDVSPIYGNFEGHTGSIVRYIGDNCNQDGQGESWEVRETPAEIAAMLAGNAREERIRANAWKYFMHELHHYELGCACDPDTVAHERWANIPYSAMISRGFEAAEEFEEEADKEFSALSAGEGGE